MEKLINRSVLKSPVGPALEHQVKILVSAHPLLVSA